MPKDLPGMEILLIKLSLSTSVVREENVVMFFLITQQFLILSEIICNVLAEELFIKATELTLSVLDDRNEL